MNPPEQDQQNQPEEKVPLADPDASATEGAEAGSAAASPGSPPSEEPKSDQPALSTPPAAGAEDPSPPEQSAPGQPASEVPVPASSAQSDAELGSNPRKILQELEKEYNSEKKEMLGLSPDGPAASSPLPKDPLLSPAASLPEDGTADELITEAMRELDALIKTIKESA